MRHEDRQDRRFMRLALSLASRGYGKVNPNPLVGAVVVNRGEVVGKGYHRFFGGSHAEVEALEDGGKKCRGSDLYVNLEPCCHYGKTPPCTGVIRSKGVKRVIMATGDPNPLVNGRGEDELKRSGISVVKGILEEEARKLNSPFFKFMESGKSYISVKMAITMDGFISDAKGRSQWITSPLSRKVAHRIRAAHDAVLVGPKTIRADDPALNVRLRGNYRQPKKILLFPPISKYPDANAYRMGDGEIIVVTTKEGAEGIRNKGKLPRIEIVEMERERGYLPRLMNMLPEKGITSILIEGGSGIFSGILEAMPMDRIYIFMAGKILGKGISPFRYIEERSVHNPYAMRLEKVRKIDNDLLIEYGRMNEEG